MAAQSRLIGCRSLQQADIMPIAEQIVGPGMVKP
jgi:hypothetical protein